MSSDPMQGLPPDVVDAFRRVDGAQRAGHRKVDGPERVRRLELDRPRVVYLPDARAGADFRLVVAVVSGVLAFVALIIASTLVADALTYAVGPGAIGLVLLLVSVVAFVRSGEQVEQVGAYLLEERLVLRARRGAELYDRARIGGLGASKKNVFFSYPDSAASSLGSRCTSATTRPSRSSSRRGTRAATRR